VELHAHTAFSFLDGASLPDEMADAAAALGHSALAITDHDTLSGSMEFAHAATAAGIRPITGAELSISHFHITLLCESAQGYANLCRLITIAHAHTRSARDRRAGDPLLTMEALEAHHHGLVCLTGCARHGLVPRLLAAGRDADAREALGRLADTSL
jgi:error-prone DNA polymerase